MNLPAVLIEVHYLPSLEYFCALQQSEKVILEKHENYVKQSYRNRCYINTAHGIERLVVPVTGKHGKVPVCDVKVESGVRWRNNQWRTIQSAYAKAPFFEHYSDELNQVIFSNSGFLFDMNLTLLSLCLRNLGIKKPISETVTYEKEPGKYIFDLRSRLKREKEGSEASFYRPQPYHQVFGNSFADNLSLIDLLFCEGPAALGILKASMRTDLNK